MVDRPEEQNANPESGAITGGVPAAAEPSPQVRGREASARSAVYVFIVLGVALLITAIFADVESKEQLGVVLAGVILLALGGFRIVGVLDDVLTSMIGFITGIGLTVVAFTADDFGGAQLVLVVCGAATFIVSFASLAASRRPAQGDEEPTPGVENV